MSLAPQFNVIIMSPWQPSSKQWVAQGCRLLSLWPGPEESYISLHILLAGASHMAPVLLKGKLGYMIFLCDQKHMETV